MNNMHSPPDSSDMFVSSPSYIDGSGPEEEVEMLSVAAKRVKTVDATLRAIIDKVGQAFFDVFGRQIQLLKSRSQAFEDAHVTVYDKILLSLTGNGNDLESPAAITWYCTEYLGFQPKGDSGRNAQVIEQALTVPIAITQALTPPLTQEHPPLAEQPKQLKSAAAWQPTTDSDPKFNHLWTVYQRAHADYSAVADARNESTLQAVKFLRDTAENGIHFLRDKDPKHPALQELAKTYDMAKSIAVDLNGGKKRKFDRAMEYGDRKSDKKHRSKILPSSRASTARGREPRVSGYHRPRGRGPSGIPFGYTRPVDSYHPI